MIPHRRTDWLRYSPLTVVHPPPPVRDDDPPMTRLDLLDGIAFGIGATLVVGLVIYGALSLVWRLL